MSVFWRIVFAYIAVIVTAAFIVEIVEVTR